MHFIEVWDQICMKQVAKDVLSKSKGKENYAYEEFWWSNLGVQKGQWFKENIVQGMEDNK